MDDDQQTNAPVIRAINPAIACCRGDLSVRARIALSEMLVSYLGDRDAGVDADDER